ncbi:MAG: prepilin-type N-terminal cleavage/methylation domain-containing protein [Gammaproteobacteria bacterium]|nr:prepilin-type N-terminal cleavage/methylation domain-containing protein [Gammaproteobacteria bacterium]MDH3373483.1 prepilin-type N-terminal cleavage/methylation domain-containing protein [Gammaproteobacteria bacterium]MDH3408239.1 prepilin-type N-terminal cleavage/methylation domain-containing protein [Gammaproteobacteria bacterium]MDH3552709.1 prepilin-type N-terminal cleavage/methylation domain-containing protein [Gammaproteobacteria bacterium]
MISREKYTAQSGFTLVELLIVVIILAILAAIIIPQFTAATDDATQSAYDTNIANIRSAIDLYRQQHQDYPGAVVSTGAGCPAGSANVVGAVGEPAFIAQLRNYTNAAGVACTGTDATFRYGPYLKDDLPDNPLGAVPNNTVTVVTTGLLGLTSGGTDGWRFDSVTGEFIGDE